MTDERWANCWGLESSYEDERGKRSERAFRYSSSSYRGYVLVWGGGQALFSPSNSGKADTECNTGAMGQSYGAKLDKDDQ